MTHSDIAQKAFTISDFFRLFIALAKGIDRHTLHLLCLQRPVIIIYANLCNPIHHIHPLYHFAKGGIASVQMRRCRRL